MGMRLDAYGTRVSYLLESSESQDPTNHVDGGTRFTALAHSRTTVLIVAGC